MSGPLAQLGQRAANHARLPGHFDHCVPFVVLDPVVGTRLATICGDQQCTVWHRTARAPRQTGDVITGANRLTRQLVPEPGGATEDEDVHGAVLEHSLR